MLRTVIITILIIFIVTIGSQLYLLFKKGRDLSSELADLKEKVVFFNKENGVIEGQISFLSRWENFEKELKAKFNYKKIGEKMMIILP